MDVAEQAAIREAAHADLTQQLTAWAMRHFPSVTDLAWAQLNRGASGARPAFVGTWNGYHLEIGAPRTDGTQHAWLLRPCLTCGLYTNAYPYPVAHASQIADIVERVADTVARPDRATVPSPMTDPVEACRACSWLLRTQEIARTRKTPLQRFWFRLGRPFTAEEILAVKPGQPIPQPAVEY